MENNKENKRKEKVTQALKDKKIVDDSSFAVFQLTEDLKEYVDEQIDSLKEEFDKELSVDSQAEKIAIKLAVKLAAIEKGDKGDMPTPEELRALITPLIPAPLKAETYTLTDKDKKDIAKSIEVPIVEKQIEIIREKIDGKIPVKGVDYFTDEDINKISLTALSQHPFTSVEDLTKALNYDKTLKEIKEAKDIAVANAMPVTTNFFNGLRAKNLNIVGGTATQSGDTVSITVSAAASNITGFISAGTNVTITGVGTAGSPYVINASGGGGSPGGSTTQIQYNNAGSFAGITGATSDGTSVTLTSPTLITPALGVAIATSINALSLASAAVGFTIAGGTSSKTLTLQGNLTVSSTMTLAGAGAGVTMTFPGSSDTVVTLAASQTLTNKTLTSPTLTTPSLGVATATSINGVALTTGGSASAYLNAAGTYTTPAGGGSPSIGGTITSGTDGSVLFVNPSGTIAQNNNNFYFQNSASTPTTLATNTNVAHSVNTNGDFSGTDAINAYAQYDAYLPNSLITNSLTGLNTDGAVPGFTTSSSRGTGASPSQLVANDMVGGYFGFGAQGAVSPSYQNLGGMAVVTTGASANNLGGQLNFYTKADGGSLTQQMSISNSGVITAVNLAGTGTQMVTADINGVLSKQAIPSGTGTVTSVAVDSTLTGGTITTTGTLGINLTTANTWTGSPTISTVPLIISGNQSAASWTTNGIQLRVAAATLNDTTSSGTVTTEAASAFGIPTITSTSSTTFTNFATVYIAGAPVNSTNVTITNKWSLYVGAGNTSLGGTLNVGSSTQSNSFQTTNSFTTSNFATASNSTVGAQNSTASLLFGGAANVQNRVYFAGNTSTALTANASYSNLIVASSPVTAAASGTHSVLANMVVNPLGTVTNGSSIAITTTATLLVNGAGTGGTNNYALQVISGNNYYGGKDVVYNGVTTAGWGTPAIYSAGRATAQTAANASVATYTCGAADGTFMVSANVLVTTSSAESFTVTVSYTDEGNTARTLTLNFQTLGAVIGTTIAFANGAVPYEGIPTHIRVKASTAITIKTAAGGTYTGCTYNCEGIITQLS